MPASKDRILFKQKKAMRKITAKVLTEMIDKLEKIPKRRFIPLEEWIHPKKGRLDDFIEEISRVKEKR